MLVGLLVLVQLVLVEKNVHFVLQVGQAVLQVHINHPQDKATV